MYVYDLSLHKSNAYSHDPNNAHVNIHTTHFTHTLPSCHINNFTRTRYSFSQKREGEGERERHVNNINPRLICFYFGPWTNTDSIHSSTNQQTVQYASKKKTELQITLVHESLFPYSLVKFHEVIAVPQTYVVGTL